MLSLWRRWLLLKNSLRSNVGPLQFQNSNEGTFMSPAGDKKESINISSRSISRALFRGWTTHESVAWMPSSASTTVGDRESYPPTVGSRKLVKEAFKCSSLIQVALKPCKIQRPGWIPLFLAIETSRPFLCTGMKETQILASLDYLFPWIPLLSRKNILKIALRNFLFCSPLLTQRGWKDLRPIGGARDWGFEQCFSSRETDNIHQPVHRDSLVSC